jgi:hypothetical protein
MMSPPRGQTPNWPNRLTQVDTRAKTQIAKSCNFRLLINAA